ncbi:conserved protein of unknown function [Rhodovastum atsumiense]|uniref:Uncharacterized protein n=1 Tax=Rhodovastum atsumiense TaxID=504468 RepID=A0A5M6IWY7_9PROT|nr:hypothetical protein [Rhodovastum atsumiense]KAA5612479.1 hypothetical protein F1189_09915 [Rhodovastum atsumiense]CAH2600396.1 conserved protein of unknown function [Rhodovastum atsumiense]
MRFALHGSRCYIADMTLPFPLPDWLPWWVPVAVLVPGLLYLLVFLLMPFSVFGLKGRLDAIEERLDEIQAEIRTIVLRLPELRGGGSGSTWADPPPIAPPPRDTEERLVRPPIPPAPMPAPRRTPPIEPSWRPAPDPSTPLIRRAEEPPPDQATAPEDEAPRRRTPGQPARRSEPRLDWPR